MNRPVFSCFPLRHVLAVALVYFLLGIAGMVLSLPAGMAEPFFPPAGFALAVVLHWGNRLLPAIWLGEVGIVMCFWWAGFGQPDVSWVNMLIGALCLGLGNSLQAWLGQHWIRRVLPATLDLEEDREILLFLLLGGPAACVVSASVSTGVTLVMGSVPLWEAAYNGWTWWLGDTLGVLLFAPLTLMILRRRQPQWSPRWRMVVGPTVLASLCVMAAFAYVLYAERTALRNRVSDHGQFLVDLLDKELAAHGEMLSALGQHIALSPNLSYQSFVNFAGGALERHADLAALEWIPAVSDSDRAHFEHSMRQTLKRPFQIRDRQAGQIIPAAVRPHYFPAAYVVPFDPNQAAVGIDQATDPLRQAALDAALSSTRLQATAPLRLQRFNPAQAGVLLFYPVFNPNDAGLLGFSAAVLSIRESVAHSIGRYLQADQQLRIDDITDPATPQLLYITAYTGQPLVTEAEFQRDFEIGERRWRIGLTPTLRYGSRHRSLMAWTVMPVGLALVALLQAVLLAMAGRSALIQHKVNEQTELLRQQTTSLQASEARLRAILDTEPECVHTMDAEYRVLQINRAGLAMLEADNSEQILGYSAVDLVKPEHRTAFTEMNQRVLSTGQAQSLLFEIRGFKGGCRWLETYAAPLWDTDRMLILAVTRDVSERIVAEQRLRDSESFTRSILNTAPEAMLLVNNQGRIVLANTRAQMLYGYTADALLQQTVETLIPARFRELHRTQRHHYAQAPRIRAMRESREIFALHRDGHEFEVEVGLGPMHFDGQDYVVVSVADISERKRAEAEHERLRAQLQQAQKMEAIGQLTGGIAHDFNNMLAAMLGYTHLALERCVPDKTGKLAGYLHEVITAGERGRDLIAKMLAFSRGAKAMLGPVDAGIVVQEVIKTLRPVLPSSIHIRLDIQEDLPAIRSDPVQLHQLLINLIINARDAVDEHGDIHVILQKNQADRICDSCHQSVRGEFIELSVQDNGCGIADEILHRIFDPFFTTKEVGKGTGMGLAMVHGIMHDHGGHVCLNSQPQQGTTVRLLFPLAQPRERVVNA